MKKIPGLILTLFTANMLNAQSVLYVQANTTVSSMNNPTITLSNCDLNNNSATGDFSGATVVLNGNRNSSLSGTGSLVFSNITINKSGGKNVSLLNNISVGKLIKMQKGYLDVAGKNIVLTSSTAKVSGETETARIIGSTGGTIRVSKKLNQPVSQNPGNLGAVITSSQNLGNVTVTRGFLSQTNNGTGKSINRYYSITTGNVMNSPATLRINYFDAELNGLTESDLNLWESADNGVSYTSDGYTSRDATANYVEISGLGNLDRFTLSSSIFSIPGSSVAAANYSSITNQFKIQLIPNPVNNEAVAIVITPCAAEASVTVNTTDGKTIFSIPAILQAGTNQIRLSTTTLAGGTYFLKVATKNFTQTIPFIKQ